MGTMRAMVRLVTLALASVLAVLALFVALTLFRLLRRPSDHLKATVFRRWAGASCRILGVRLEVTGDPPAPPFFLVSNHQGFVDVVVLASLLDCVFIAMAEAGRWPVVGAMCRSVDTLFIDRKVKRDVLKVTERVYRVLRGGRGVVFFPEGVATDGTRVLPFRPALLEAAARARIPVHHAAIRYETPPGSPPARIAVTWADDVSFAVHLLRALRLPSIRAKVIFGARPVRRGDRKELAERLRREVMNSLDLDGGMRESRPGL